MYLHGSPLILTIYYLSPVFGTLSSFLVSPALPEALAELLALLLTCDDVDVSISLTVELLLDELLELLEEVVVVFEVVLPDDPLPLFDEFDLYKIAKSEK